MNRPPAALRRMRDGRVQIVITRDKVTTTLTLRRSEFEALSRAIIDDASLALTGTAVAR